MSILHGGTDKKHARKTLFLLFAPLFLIKYVVAILFLSRENYRTYITELEITKAGIIPELNQLFLSQDEVTVVSIAQKSLLCGCTFVTHPRFSFVL